eukprot:1950766-Rhodomonas_salina.3
MVPNEPNRVGIQSPSVSVAKTSHFRVASVIKHSMSPTSPFSHRVTAGSDSGMRSVCATQQRLGGGVWH